jgi:hypothetical protein
VAGKGARCASQQVMVAVSVAGTVASAFILYGLRVHWPVLSLSFRVLAHYAVLFVDRYWTQRCRLPKTSMRVHCPCCPTGTCTAVCWRWQGTVTALQLPCSVWWT